MKWAKLKSKTEPTKDELKCYKEFDNQLSLDNSFGIKRKEDYEDNKEHKRPASHHLWVHYRLRRYIEPERQRDYEIFTGGWLQFYDKIVRSGAVDHIIHFEWSPKEKPYTVDIYLIPAPQKKLKEKQSKPTATAANDAEPQVLQDKAVAEAVAAPARDAATFSLDDQVDPPKVPPPPPPMP